MHRPIFIALAVFAAGPACAQSRERPDPTQPQAKVPPAEYRPAFEGYRRLAEEKLAPWRETNEAVKPKPADTPPAGGQHGDRR